MVTPCSSPQVPAPHRAAEGYKTQGAQKDDPLCVFGASASRVHANLAALISGCLLHGEVGESGASASGLPSGAGGPVPVSTDELSALTGGGSTDVGLEGPS